MLQIVVAYLKTLNINHILLRGKAFDLKREITSNVEGYKCAVDWVMSTLYGGGSFLYGGGSFLYSKGSWRMVHSGRSQLN